VSNSAGLLHFFQGEKKKTKKERRRKRRFSLSLVRETVVATVMNYAIIKEITL
jgi:hypothetical protein